jgi:O-antigen ligase
MKNQWRSFVRPFRLKDISSRAINIELLIVFLLYYSVYSQSVFLEPIFGTFPNANYVLLGILVIYISFRVYTGVHLSQAALIAIGSFVLFCLYYSATIIWSPSSEYALFKIIRLLTVIPLLFIVTALLATDSNGEQRIARMFKYIIGLSGLIAIITFYARGFDHSVSGLIGVNYLLYSRVLGAGVLASVLFAVSSNTRRETLMYAGVAATLVAAMLLTGGRGPLIAAAVASAGIVVFKHFQVGWSVGWRSAVAGVGISIFGLVVLATIIGARTAERFVGLLTLQDESASTRLDLYWIAIESWVSEPLLGHGIGSYSIVGETGRHPYWPHNIVLEIGAEAGLVGVALFAIPLIVSLRQFVKYQHEMSPSGLLAIAFVGYMFINASLTGDVPGNRALFVAIPMLFVIDRSPQVKVSVRDLVVRVCKRWTRSTGTV